MARSMIGAGMSGCVLKCHMAPTAGRAALVRKVYPQFNAVGSVTLNKPLGGLNPDAVVTAGKMGARYVWFPTMDAKAYMEHRHQPDADMGLTVKDTDGTLCAPAKKVIEAAVKYDMIIGTGHLSPQESLMIVRYASSCGAKRICVTHVTHPNSWMDSNQLKEAQDLGAYIEFSYNHINSGQCSWERAVSQIQEVKTERLLLTTDFGQKKNVLPVEGMIEFLSRLSGLGVSDGALKRALCDNPRAILGIN